MGTQEKGNAMDIESHLHRVEAQGCRTKTHVEILLVIVGVPVGLGLLGIFDTAECLVSILVVLALIGVAHVLISAAFGLRRFWTIRNEGAQVQERILREFIAERAKP